MFNSMFGADFGSSALNAAYDMMILDEIEKDDKEIALRKIYDNNALTSQMEDDWA